MSRLLMVVVFISYGAFAQELTYTIVDSGNEAVENVIVLNTTGELLSISNASGAVSMRDTNDLRFLYYSKFVVPKTISGDTIKLDIVTNALDLAEVRIRPTSAQDVFDRKIRFSRKLLIEQGEIEIPGKLYAIVQVINKTKSDTSYLVDQADFLIKLEAQGKKVKHNYSVRNPQRFCIKGMDNFLDTNFLAPFSIFDIKLEDLVNYDLSDSKAYDENFGKYDSVNYNPESGSFVLMNTKNVSGNKTMFLFDGETLKSRLSYYESMDTLKILNTEFVISESRSEDQFNSGNPYSATFLSRYTSAYHKAGPTEVYEYRRKIVFTANAANDKELANYIPIDNMRIAKIFLSTPIEVREDEALPFQF